MILRLRPRLIDDNLRQYNGYTFDFELIARQLYRVTTPGGVVVWVVGDATIDGSESGTSFRQALGFMAVGFNLHDTMIYEVAGTGAKGSDLAYWQAFEYMFVFSKGTPRSVNLLRDRKNVGAKPRSNIINSRRKSDGTKIKDTRKPIEDYGRRLNIWRYSALEIRYHNKTDHPAPFPDGLARDHIVSWSNPGDVILDPMVGSGTTAKQAYLLGRYYLGFEISQEYVDLANRRVAQAMAQPKLFPWDTNTHASYDTNGTKQLGFLDD